MRQPAQKFVFQIMLSFLKKHMDSLYDSARKKCKVGVSNEILRRRPIRFGLRASIFVIKATDIEFSLPSFSAK